MSHAVEAPTTLEGYAALHFVYRIDWQGLAALDPSDRRRIATQAAEWFEAASSTQRGGTGLYSLIGGKGDLLLMHLQPTTDAVHAAEIAFAQLELNRLLEQTYCYYSVTEVSLHGDPEQRRRATLEARGIVAGTDEWEVAMEALIEEEQAFNRMRLEPEIPKDRYVCFYPMSKRRGETWNWYALSARERGALMRGHAEIGRKYAGKVLQLVTGSVGLDDYEWGVTLFAQDPVLFKKLVYEMRFDPTSAHYAEFGPFFVGIQLAAAQLPELLEGRLPA